MNSDMVVMPTMSIESVIERRKMIVDFVKQAMTPEVDYGTIPGTERRDKEGKSVSNNTLLKPGAEKLCTLFGLTVRFVEVKTIEDWTGAEHGGEPFFYYWQKCQLLKDGVVVGEADGSCNSWEKKYRYRNADRVCPTCGKPAIIRGKKEYGGGWLCFKNKGGCGAKFAEDAIVITSQQVGQIPNPDICDQVNTLLKMSQKRGMVGASLITVNASEFFTQDLDDMYIDAEVKIVEQPKPAPIVSTAPKGQTIAEREQVASATFTERSKGVEWEDLGEEVKTKAEKPATDLVGNIGKGVKIPSHDRQADAFQDLENLVAKHALAVNRVESIPDAAISRYRQQAAMNLTKTALGNDEELRHTFLKEIWGRDGLTACNVQELMALRDWSVGIPAKSYIALWVAQHPAFNAVLEKEAA